MAPPEEPKNVIIARALLTDQKPTFAWFASAFQLLTGENFTEKEYEYLDLSNYWNEEFGFVSYLPAVHTLDVNKKELLRYKIKWVRPDGGPTEPYFVMPLGADPFSFFMYIWLHAFIMLDLQIYGLCSYIEVGGPPNNWNHFSIFFDGKEFTDCISACALTGACEVHERNEHGSPIKDEYEDKLKTKIVRGHVIIAQTKDKAFF